MEFLEAKPIYAQIADRICEAVLRGTWDDEERIPSIREMAVETEVNPNTITRSYGLLQEQGIVYNRRGIGYFIASGAGEKVRKVMKQEFIENELPAFFRRLEIIGLTLDEIVEIYRNRLSDRGVSEEANHENQ